MRKTIVLSVVMAMLITWLLFCQGCSGLRMSRAYSDDLNVQADKMAVLMATPVLTREQMIDALKDNAAFFAKFKSGDKPFGPVAANWDYHLRILKRAKLSAEFVARAERFTDEQLRGILQEEFAWLKQYQDGRDARP